MTRKEQILKLAEFDADLYSENSASWIFGAQAENTRLIPLITALAERVEMLEARLENALWFQDKSKNFISHYDDCNSLIEDLEDESCECGLDAFAHDNYLSIEFSRQALTTPTALDALLKGEE